MKKIFSLLAAVLFAASMMAETSTLTFTAKCNGSGTADDDAVWTVTSDASESNFDNTKGIHYGTGSAAVSYLTLSTSDIHGTITEIVVNASGASGQTPKVNVTVGGAAFGSEATASATATDYTFTGSATGEIAVTISQNSAKKALYVKSIEVTYTPGAETKVASPKFSLAEGTYDGNQSVELSCKTEGALIYYTLDGSDPTTASTLYSSAIEVEVGTTTIKAIAIKADLENSDIVSATYTIIPAADVVLDFTDNTLWEFPVKPSDNSKITGTNNYTDGTYTVTVYGPEGAGYYYDTDNLMLGKTDAYLQLPAFADQAVARIVTTAVSAGSAKVQFNVFEGETAVSTEVTSCKVDQSFDISPKKLNTAYTIKVTSDANIRFAKIKIWFGEADPGTAINNTADEVKAFKTIENGQLVIIKNGVRYDATGAVLR